MSATSRVPLLTKMWFTPLWDYEVRYARWRDHTEDPRSVSTDWLANYYLTIARFKQREGVWLIDGATHVMMAFPTVDAARVAVEMGVRP